MPIGRACLHGISTSLDANGVEGRMMTRKLFALFAFLLMSVSLGVSASRAAEEEKPLKIEYRFTPPAPREQGEAEVAAKSAGCYSCHTRTDQPHRKNVMAGKRGTAQVEAGGRAIITKQK